MWVSWVGVATLMFGFKFDGAASRRRAHGPGVRSRAAGPGLRDWADIGLSRQSGGDHGRSAGWPVPRWWRPSAIGWPVVVAFSARWCCGRFRRPCTAHPRRGWYQRLRGGVGHPYRGGRRFPRASCADRPVRLRHPRGHQQAGERSDRQSDRPVPHRGHPIGIPITGEVGDLARSLGPALIVGGTALSQVWLFIVAPLVGGIAAAGLHWLVYPLRPRPEPAPGSGCTAAEPPTRGPGSVVAAERTMPLFAMTLHLAGRAISGRAGLLPRPPRGASLHERRAHSESTG